MTLSGIAVSTPPVSFQAGAIAPQYSPIQATQASVFESRAPNATVNFRYTRSGKAPGKRLVPAYKYGGGELPRSRRDTLPRWRDEAEQYDQRMRIFSSLQREVSPALPIATPPATAAAPEAITSMWQRADALFIETYAETFSLTDAQAQATLREADDFLYNSWRDLSNIGQVAWTPSGRDEPRSPHDLAYAATKFSQHLHTHPRLDDFTAFHVARAYLEHPPVTVVENDMLAAIYRDVLQRRLDWIDIGKVRARGMNAEQILKAVCRHRQGKALTKAALDRRLRHYRDVLIDESALIAFHASRGRHAMVGSMPIAPTRAQFVTSLIDEWQDAGLGVLLIPSAPIPPSHAAFWYDGTVLRNTRGKDLTQIVDRLYAAGTPTAETPAMQRLIGHASRGRRLLGQPDDTMPASRRENLLLDMHGNIAAGPRYEVRPDTILVGNVWLTRHELQAVVEKTLHNLAIDTVYPGATPLNAIATILHRQGPAHDVYCDRFDNATELVQAFNRLNHAWRQHPRFPVQPQLCAAYYLAESSGMLLLDARSSATAELQLMERTYSQLAEASAQTGLPPLADSSALMRRIDEIKQLPSWGRLPAFNALLQGGNLEIHLKVQQDIGARAAAPERIAYRGSADLHRQLNDYFSQRLLAQAPLPTYDEDFLILQILRGKLGMSAEDLQQANVIQASRPLSYGIRTALKLPLEEFKMRAAGGFYRFRFMMHRDKAIDPAAELDAMKQHAAQALLANPVLAAKSKEILRREGKSTTPADAREVHRLLVDNVMGVPQESSSGDLLHLLESLFGSATLATIVRALASGDPREILGLLPFIIPLYDIEEGIRLGDKNRAWDGALHFGEDAILTLLGAGAEGILRKQLARDAEAMLFAQSRMTAAERAGTEMIQRMQAILPEIAPDRLALRRVVLDDDAFDVHTVSAAQSATTPKSVEAFSSAARTPDNRAYQMVFLDGEQAPVPVIAAGRDNAFIETDLRGNPLPHAAPILLNPDSLRHYRLTRDYGLPREDGSILHENIILRRTVFDSLKYWQPVAKLPGIRRGSLPPDNIIRTVFKPNSHPLSKEFERFWVMAYERSETASTIINRAYQKVRNGAPACSVEFEAERPYAEGDSIWFIADETLSRMHYTSPAGTEPFRRSRMWVHEAIHWLTDTFDPYRHEADNNRGATIYLTDRILSELGDHPPIFPRTTYAIPPVLEASRQSKSKHHAWSRTLRKINDWTIVENMHLDRRLDEGREFPSTMHLFGKPVAERITVRQILALDGHFSSLGKLASGNGATIFNLIVDAFAAPPQLHFRGKLRTLVMGSDIFRKMAAAWNTKLRPSVIEIDMQEFDSHAQLHDNQDLHPFLIAQDSEKITLNKQELYYFSEYGLETISPMRQFAGAMLDLFLRDMIPAAYRLPLPDPFYDRGAGVLLENLVLQQIGDPSPKRICDTLTNGRHAYLASQTTITRAAVSEDGYLARKLEERLPAESIADQDPVNNAAAAKRCLSFLCLGLESPPIDDSIAQPL